MLFANRQLVHIAKSLIYFMLDENLYLQYFHKFILQGHFKCFAKPMDHHISLNIMFWVKYHYLVCRYLVLTGLKHIALLVPTSVLVTVLLLRSGTMTKAIKIRETFDWVCLEFQSSSLLSIIIKEGNMVAHRQVWNSSWQWYSEAQAERKILGLAWACVTHFLQ